MSAGAEPLSHPFFRPERAGAVPLVAPPDLHRLLEAADPPVLLDVRSDLERRWAHLPADRHVPLSELPLGIAGLPRERTIVAYDHHGADGRRAAEYLGAHGFAHTAALEGGIDEYSRIVDPLIPRYEASGNSPGLLLRQIPRPSQGCLAYFVGDPRAREAVIVDPGHDAGPYLELLREGNWKLRAIVETHTHADHLAGHAALHAATDAPIFVSHRSPAQYPHHLLSEGDAIPFGSEEIGVLETPGHTRDHLTLRVRDSLFTGDTLLIGACGRTDLGDGSPELLWESLTEKLMRLPDQVEVYPAHFGAKHALTDRWVSSIGFERATNEALRQGSRRGFLEYMTEGWPAKPQDFDGIVRANLAG